MPSFWSTTVGATATIAVTVILLAALATPSSAVQVYTAAVDKNSNNYNISEIIAFGDSLLDTGNVFELTNGAVPDGNIYYKGRFSNGRVWSEWMADGLGVPLVTLAFGGALSGATILPPGAATSTLESNWVPTAYEQVSEYFVPTFPRQDPLPSLTTSVRREGKPLYILQVGGNDYVMGVPAVGTNITMLNGLVDRIVTTMMDTVNLIQASSNNTAHVLVMGMPPMDQSPLYRNMQPKHLDIGLMATRKHNELLLNRLTAMQQRLPNARLHFYNVASFLYNVREQQQQLSFNNMRDPCLGPNMKVCANPDSYFFWDGLHPTRHVHQVLGQKVLSLLKVAITQP